MKKHRIEYAVLFALFFWVIIIGYIAIETYLFIHKTLNK